MSTTDVQTAGHEHDPNHPIQIEVNNKKVTVRGHTQTGQSIKKAAGVPESFKLFDAHGRPVADDTAVHVDGKERFTAISGQDVS